MRRVGWMLAWVLVAAAPSRAPAQTSQSADPDTSVKRSSSPADLAHDEFSLQTTGQFRQAPVREEASIPAPRVDDDRAAERAAPPAPDGTAIPVMALESNMGTRVNELLACRMQVAAERRVPISQVVAGSVLMRWTVRTDGGVDDPEVVALRDTDPDVLVCVKRKLAAWSFGPPRDGSPVRLEHKLAFAPTSEPPATENRNTPAR
jgi:hypothetical protein